MTGAAAAADPFRYPEAKHGRGELRSHGPVPVVTLEGTPAEIGEQVGVLVLKPAEGLLKQAAAMLAAHGLKNLVPLLMKTGNGMTPPFPADHLAELEAAAKHSGWPRDLLVLATTVPDLRKLTACSALIVAAEKSKTGGPLLARNLDTTPSLSLHEYAFVAAYRPAGKRAFAAVGYPGSVGCYSGMNAAGLAVADGSAKLDVEGVPYTLALRRVLEECGTADEAERLVRSLKRTTMQNLAVCDKAGGRRRWC